MKKILEYLNKLLKNKSGKVSISDSTESNEDYSRRKQDSELDDMMLDLVFLPANIVYWTGRGVYKCAKKISEIYKKYKSGAGEIK